MDKKSIFSLILMLFYIFTSFSQTNGIEVIYKAKMLTNPIDTSDVHPGDYKLVMYEEMEKLKEVLGNVNYILKANQTEAIFQYEEFMENDVNSNLMDAILASSSDGKFYTNISEDLNYWQVETYEGEFYRIQYGDRNKEWHITGEKRKIGDYQTFKATTRILLNNRLPVEVVAWFAPEIQFPFGPKGYGGLPGLIIALNERGFLFYAEKIQFTAEQKLKINQPTKGELVSPEKFEELMEKKN